MAGMFYSLQETAERLNKSEEELNRFLNNDDMQLVEMKSGALSGQGQKVMIVQPGILPADFYHIDEINKDDIYQVSGVGANQLAAEGLVQKTATEANITRKRVCRERGP